MFGVFSLEKSSYCFRINARLQGVVFGGPPKSGCKDEEKFVL